MPRPSRPRYRASRNQWTIRVKGREIYLCAGQQNEHIAWARAAPYMPQVDEQAPPAMLGQVIARYVQATRMEGEGRWRRDMLQRFAEWSLDKPVSQAKTALQDYHAWLRQQTYQPKGKGSGRRRYSPQTIRHMIGAASACLRWASQRDMCSSPLPARTAPPEIRDRSLSPADVARLIRALPERTRALVRFLALTGVRPSEACLLQWSEVAGRALQLRRGKTFQRTGQPRVVHLSSAAADLLHHLKESGCQGFVFLSHRGHPWTVSGLRASVRRASNRLSMGPVSIYSLRHSFAQSLIDAGASESDVAAALGHQPGSRAIRHYVRVTEQRARRALEFLPRELLG